MPSTDACAVDCIARLSGVNYSSVIKTLNAIVALHQALGEPYQELLDLHAIPDRATVPGAADRARVMATSRVVTQVMNSGVLEDKRCLHPQLQKLLANGSF